MTEHARKRCIKRRIRPEWVGPGLGPSGAVPRTTPMDPAWVHALLAIPERGFRVLRVIFNETVDPVVVATAYFDDRATDL